MTKSMFVQLRRAAPIKSIEIAEVYLDNLRAKHPDLEIDRLDLWKAGPPVFDGDKAAAKLNVMSGKDRDASRDCRGSNRRHCQSLHFRRSLPSPTDVEWRRSLPLKQYIDITTSTRSPLRSEAGNRLLWADREQAATLVQHLEQLLEPPVAGIGEDHHST